MSISNDNVTYGKPVIILDSRKTKTYHYNFTYSKNYTDYIMYETPKWTPQVTAWVNVYNVDSDVYLRTIVDINSDAICYGFKQHDNKIQWILPLATMKLPYKLVILDTNVTKLRKFYLDVQHMKNVKLY